MLVKRLAFCAYTDIGGWIPVWRPPTIATTAADVGVPFETDAEQGC